MTTSTTETGHTRARGLQDRPATEALALLLDSQRAGLLSLAPCLEGLSEAAAAMARTLKAGNRVAYAGAGSSGLMALADALELAGTFGIPPEQTPVLFAGGAAALLRMEGASEDDENRAAAEFATAGLGEGDMIICVSASGSTPYTLAVARCARDAGVQVTGLFNVPSSPLRDLSAIPLLLDTGPELVAGSTRLTAATAQKAALNMISTLAAIRLGHVHDGHMVNLTADNAKLRDRSARIVGAIAGCGEQDAHSAIAKARGMVKPAVLIAAGVPDTDTALDMLSAAGGRLGPALTTLIGK